MLLIHGSCWNEQTLQPGLGMMAGSSVPAQVDASSSSADHISLAILVINWRTIIFGLSGVPCSVVRPISEFRN